MTQALTDVYASTDDRVVLEDGKLPYTSWSGTDIDIVHMSDNTLAPANFITMHLNSQGWPLQKHQETVTPAAYRVSLSVIYMLL